MSAQSLKIVFISGNSEEPDEMPHSAEWLVNLGLLHLSKDLFMGLIKINT